MPEVRDGVMKGGLPYLAVGEGPPLVVFPASAPSHANPTGLQRRLAARFLAPLARGGFAVYNVNRKVGLRPGATMADIAADYAVALGPAFGEPVDVLGISTGGSVAQQFAVDHPGCCAGSCSLERPTVWDRSPGRPSGAAPSSRKAAITDAAWRRRPRW
jgi:pimeloyl-ACP methyl ester carboxylesterase